MYSESNFIAVEIKSDKGLDEYIFFYDDGDEERLLDVFKNYANDSELSFTSKHASLLETKVRIIQEKRLKSLDITGVSQTL